MTEKRFKTKIRGTGKYDDLTVKEARDVLNELIEQGYGDYELWVGYDSNYVYTDMCTHDIRICNGKFNKIIKFNE